MPFPINSSFESKRFRLRPLGARDFKVWRAAHEAALPKQNEFDEDQKNPDELTAKAYAKLLKKHREYWRAGQIYHFGVFEKKTGRLMGFILFALVARFNVQSARITYGLLNNFWKRSYGKEVVEAAALFAFRKMKLHRLEAEIQPHNRASVALARSVGFQYEGMRRGAVYFGGRWHDHAIYALLAEDKGVRAPRPVILR